ncbi:MAG: RNA polymerase sigma factor [Phycisphaerae bacterium]
MIDNDSISDEQLIARFVKGQADAFDEIVNRYYKAIFRFLVRFTGREHLAEDLIQEVFMKVYRSANTFDVTKKFRPWLYSVAANRARDALRSASRNGKHLAIQSGGTEDEISLVHLVPGVPSPPDQEMIARETTRKVKVFLMELPEPLREILILSYYDQMPYKEIADTLGIPLGTVKSRLHKAVTTFGELWKRHESESVE